MNKLKRLSELLPYHGRDPGSNPGTLAKNDTYKGLV